MQTHDLKCVIAGGIGTTIGQTHAYEIAVGDQVDRRIATLLYNQGGYFSLEVPVEAIRFCPVGGRNEGIAFRDRSRVDMRCQ
jgi:hypothetical protein